MAPHRAEKWRSTKRMRSRFWQTTIFYGIYLFLYFFTEYVAVRRAARFFAPERAYLLYGVALLVSAAGYGVFAPLFRGIRSRRFLRGLLLFLVLLYAAVLLPLCSAEAALLPVFALVAMFLVSALGGVVHFYLAFALDGTPYTGRVIGVGICIAALLQSAVILFFSGFVVPVIAVALVLVGTALFAFLLLESAGNRFLPVPRMVRVSPQYQPDARLMVFLMLAIALVMLSGAVGNTVLTVLYSAGSIAFSSVSRIAYALAALLAGALADLKNRIVFPAYLLTVLLLSLLGLLFLGVPAMRMVYAVLMYVCSGTYVVCITGAFLRLAPATRRPRRWAAMGRMLRAAILGGTALLLNEPVSAMLNAHSLTILQFFSALPAIGALWIAVWLRGRVPSEILTVMFGAVDTGDGASPISAEADGAAVSADTADASAVDAAEALQDTDAAQNVEATETAPDDEPPPSADARQLFAFLARYPLTPREADVLAVVLESDGTVRELSEALHLSERMVYRYLSSIYEKTGTANRATLLKLFYKQDWQQRRNTPAAPQKTPDFRERIDPMSEN